MLAPSLARAAARGPDRALARRRTAQRSLLIVLVLQQSTSAYIIISRCEHCKPPSSAIGELSHDQHEGCNAEGGRYGKRGRDELGIQSYISYRFRTAEFGNREMVCAARAGNRRDCPTAQGRPRGVRMVAARTAVARIARPAPSYNGIRVVARRAARNSSGWVGSRAHVSRSHGW